MQKNNSFTIYNASAGSGKTFTLVKEYLMLLLGKKSNDAFKNILAVTFTNKAVGEMKERIIEALKKFSSKTILENPNDMFQMIVKELEISPEDLQQKAKAVLTSILYNYSAFNISTIDGFTHKLIQTFAHDLKVPLNFEVELDQDALINDAVNKLINKAGTDKALTKILVEFALEKTDDDKSWDVAYDFNKIAKLLVNENDIKFIETLKDKSVEDFIALKIKLKDQIKFLEDSITKIAQSVLTLIEESGLEHGDFSRKTLPNHFIKASNLELDRLYDNQLQINISENKNIYTKTLDGNLAAIIDSILPEIETNYLDLKTKVYEHKFLKAVYKNITPLSVLNAINQELNAIKEEQNKMLISEFNSIISKEIKGQPTPFIYERLGEKFRHYFIDEFQDTSILQWENLIPLIDNSLSSENGTTMLVGDAKQAIYRWRGGEAEQFIGLFNDKNPFHVEKEVFNLPTNYRSYEEIINFNNPFFKYLSSNVFSNSAYQELYGNAKQETVLENKGYVSLHFLDINQGDNKDEFYTQEVYNAIQKCLENNFQLKDICVLVRKKKEGVAIANFLNEKEIPVISSETLLINNSPKVVFVNNVLKLLLNSNDLQIKVQVLNFLAVKHNINDKHNFFESFIYLKLSEFFKNLSQLDIYFDETMALQMPLYDLVEYIIRAFKIIEKSDAYIQFYLDAVLDFSQKEFSDIESFVDYFEDKKETLSIITPHGQDAVQIMTIHKAKGLEFPIVIFPYADLNIYAEKDPKEWFPHQKNNFNGISYTLLNFNRDFENFGETGSAIYNERRSKLELDNINLLYVALTRPIEQLYIISKKEKEAAFKTYSGMFINYLQSIGKWNESQSFYEFGSIDKNSEKESSEEKIINNPEFITTAKESHNINIVTNSGYLWDTEQQNAIEKGNLIHNIMAQIKTKNDIDFVFNDFLSLSIINKTQAEELKKVVYKIIEHSKIEEYFLSNYIIYNEKEILTNQGKILRPDRLVINSKKEVVIIDYKTGEEKTSHILQLDSYEDILNTMSYKVNKKILVYINDKIEIKEI
ncbi:UvrD-helicase domain-containing protein [Yeosuana sp. MJ-SS3]|uniref:DNA 3'-5' helicase n=1 Tax=Gilvirhabdus luticola TaxID=3079858 RepID=A0ABU3U2X9_9FLAO|nr:UvrD-helicase domain-containing protein [Yeosuana sp. MJ-SS3]MDU8884762.1 UvrD-helicase domain-containing protein [Yeosuana sp. MJ-SS3]